VHCKRHEDLVQFFKMERGFVACTDIDGLMQTLNINHNRLDWQLFIDSSNWVSKKFSFTMATTYLLFLLVIQCIIRSHMRTWIFWWKPLIMINSNGKSVVTWKWLPYYLDCNKDSQNIATSFVNGTEEVGLFLAQERIGLPENPWNQESWMWKINH